MLDFLRLPREPPKHARIPALTALPSLYSELRYALLPLGASFGRASARDLPGRGNLTLSSMSMLHCLRPEPRVSGRSALRTGAPA